MEIFRTCVDATSLKFPISIDVSRPMKHLPSLMKTRGLRPRRYAKPMNRMPRVYGDPVLYIMASSTAVTSAKPSDVF